MAERLADLHLHTRFSDGTDPVERVVELAKQAGLSAMAITDHDNLDAIPLARPLAQRAGIELVPGIEMSASADGTEVHILGYCFDVHSAPLKAHVAEQQARRVRRVHEMVRRLGAVGVTLDAEEILAGAGDGTVGRPHVAQALRKHGYVSSMAEAFDRYLGPRQPGFVPGSPLPPSRIIKVIRAAGGVPVLAHPIYLRRDPLIEQFVKDGIVGLEVYHSGHQPEDVRRYEALADRLQLLRTGGSDSHGDSKEGLPVGSVTVPYGLVASLKAWAQSHPATSAT